jgi:hypothetical protein
MKGDADPKDVEVPPERIGIVGSLPHLQKLNPKTGVLLSQNVVPPPIAHPPKMLGESS